MNEVLTKILQRNQVTTDNGEIIPLDSSIDINECEFVQGLIKENNLTQSIEIGCAMGISSLAICEAIQTNSSNGFHIVVDPFQTTQWKSIGLHNLKQAGFNNYTHYEEKSEFILPKLLGQGVTVDFGFIDGWHTFDHTLLDFFYLNRMLKVGGVIVIDDVQMGAINKAIRFIHKYPCYEFIASVIQPQTTSRNLLENIKSIIRPFAKLSGRRLSSELFSANLLQSDKSLGTNSSMVAFRKTAEDNRPWDWHENF